MSGGSLVLMSLAIYGLAIVIAMLTAVMIRVIVTLLSRAAKKSASPVVVATPTAASVPVSDPAENDIAVIAAAVYAMLGTRRIVHIGPAQVGTPWTHGGRTRHQASHVVRRPHGGR